MDAFYTSFSIEIELDILFHFVSSLSVGKALNDSDNSYKPWRVGNAFTMTPSSVPEDIHILVLLNHIAMSSYSAPLSVSFMKWLDSVFTHRFS